MGRINEGEEELTSFFIKFSLTNGRKRTKINT